MAVELRGISQIRETLVDRSDVLVPEGIIVIDYVAFSAQLYILGS